jgi:O-Antigen ligase
MIARVKVNQQNIYFIGLALIAIGLPLSTAAMSMGQMILVANWLVDKNVLNKFRNFFKSKIALAISSLFLLHLIGLIYTTDFAYAYKDLRVKFPLLILPLIVSTTDHLDIKRFRLLLLIFISAVIASTFASMYNYFTLDFQDIREICIYVSHIRLSLFICLSIFILFHFIFSVKDFTEIQKFIFTIAALWLIVFLYILESVTGLTIFVITGVLLIIIKVFLTKNLFYKTGFIALAIVFSLTIFLYVSNIFKEYFSYTSDHDVRLEKYTAHGNPYFNDSLDNETENGHYIYRYLCEPELKGAWNKRSNIKYDSRDHKGQFVKSTLIRFLTSKGLRKDSESVYKLSAEEINSIENGVSNVNCQDEFSLRTRIYETIWEIDNYSRRDANPNNHSVMQRMEYWKASWQIIKEHWLFGVGTGDMNIAFARQYDKMHSPLDKKWRLRSHNQFLSITVGFGIFGLLWFLFVLAYPFSLKSIRKDYYYFVFFIILLLSMTSEDTIESQAGLTFFVFFCALFLLGRKDEILSSKP